MANAGASGPTALRILLGSELRRLREKADVSSVEAARAIGGSESKISRMELGRSGFKEADVAILLSLYGITDEEERDQLLSLARRANQPGWWHSYGDVLPSWFQSYIGLEQAAARIRTYEPHFVPGLLQTEDYAAAVISLGDFPPEEVERRVSLRATRQRRFRDGALRLWAVIDEVALRRPVGGPEVLRGQLEYLMAVAKQPGLTLQVTPFAASAKHAAPGGFTIMRFADPQLPDVVYVEQLGNALYLDKREDVDRYTLAMDRLSVVSAIPDESIDIIGTILEGI
ncbi:helix-turn-helix domain-containing protein [Actinoallomurus purpureus]|uniref:helix-turn-helix domain-containing protein n=1 Tax=Actinoallomurus purpureus TaxID=478114 RepID=UPI002092B442|nr:helix-turn-helix transcriptional regulator [Actinoallomurus purpureus]MCO6005274.1 helix-turn-helix domain-containing protein [Actinoallomurus purpureus]